MAAITPSHVAKLGFYFSIRQHHFESFTRPGRYQSMNSVDFPCGVDQKTVWRLRLYPHGESEESAEYSSLFLSLISSDGPVRTRFKLGFISGKNELNVRSFQKTMPEGTSFGSKMFISREEILNEANGYFRNNILTVFCDLQVYRRVEVPDSGLMSSYSRIFESGKYADVTIEVEGEELKAHKVVLAMGSPVFEAMFDHDMEESRTGRVLIEDLDVVAVQALLKFFYSGGVPDLEGIAEKVLPAADKYGVERLKVLCEDSLADKIDAENVAELLCLADLHSAKQLKAQALAFVNANSAEVVKQAGFWELEKNNKLFKDAVEALAEREGEPLAKRIRLS